MLFGRKIKCCLALLRLADPVSVAVSNKRSNVLYFVPVFSLYYCMAVCCISNISVDANLRIVANLKIKSTIREEEVYIKDVTLLASNATWYMPLIKSSVQLSRLAGTFSVTQRQVSTAVATVAHLCLASCEVLVIVTCGYASICTVEHCFRRVRKLAKIVMPVRLSVRMEHLGSHWMDFF